MLVGLEPTLGQPVVPFDTKGCDYQLPHYGIQHMREPVRGIEPQFSAYDADVLPLYDTGNLLQQLFPETLAVPLVRVPLGSPGHPSSVRDAGRITLLRDARVSEQRSGHQSPSRILPPVTGGTSPCI